LRRIEAETEESARGTASANGAAVVRCDRVQPAFATAMVQRLRGVFAKAKTIDTVVFSQDMATLMDAGVTVKEAIRALHRQDASAARRAILGQVDTLITEGLSFSAALARTQAFPELLIATVAASEETGDLANGLTRYAKHQQSLRTVRDRVIGACVYPLLLLVVGSLVVALLLGVVVPRFASLIDSDGRELPWLSKLLMGWGHFVDGHAWAPVAMLLGMVALLVFGFFQAKNPRTRNSLLKRIPGAAGVVREFQHLQMYRTTAILTSRGISIHKALVHSIEFLNPDDQRRLKASLRDMQEGIGVSAALSQTGLADVIAGSMLSVAEQAGSMPEMLDRIADFYERNLQRRIEIVSKLIEPILMIIFGIVIGGIVVLMYLPIFDLASSIS